ncbi:MAG: SAM-dependent methyltransferase, partial [Mycobacterium sp.]
LIVDSGCLHGMNDDDRYDYVREITAAAAPDARLHIVAFAPGSSYGVPGIEPDEVELRFGAAGWTLLSSGTESGNNHKGKEPAHFYVFQRAV